ncbi:alpha/beta hydrolase [Tropicimonas sp. IMCC34043]|uniref:alpha/beta hydrolase n=1 Tax=Tropicimonas sp. IMCC34043 TaxID=2248760 RepID=UPI000E21E453|nr:alpha/beta hydrolase [Tropicimonas sp. IMCC34043]
MPLFKVNATAGQLANLAELDAGLRAALAATSPEAPVVVLIHGYKFSPARAKTSPHTHILSLDPVRSDWKTLSWPRALGIGHDAPDEPLCIAFGWEARGTLWQAYGRAAETGQALARLIALIRQICPGRPVDVLAHSFGARVALAALPHLPAGAMGRAVLLAPAEMCSPAAAWLATPAGRTVEILAVRTGENGLYDRALGWLVAPHRIGDRALGLAAAPAPNWTSLDIDRPEVRRTLAAHGHRIAPRKSWVCHWSVYLRPGLFPFYRAVLDRRLPLSALRQPAPPSAPSLRARLGQAALRPLLLARGQAS